MKREVVSFETPIVWPTSKCQRALRPLRLKIASLEQSLSASHCVTDGLTAWSSVYCHRRLKQDSTSDDSAAYRPSQQKVRKYGVSRKQGHEPQNKARDLCPDTLLNTVRANYNGNVGSAYLGVYYAFTAILDKAKVQRRFPSLATRAAYAVGSCVHLTSDSFTDEPIDSDNWYDAVPAHHRASVVIGHATQLILSAEKTLQPILPAIALALQDSSLSAEVMETILERTDLSTCRKSDTEFLQNLALQLKMPWLLKIHFSRSLKLDYIAHASFTCLLDLKSVGLIDDATQTLCLKTTNVALQFLRKRKELTAEADLRLYDTLQAISFRVLGARDVWVLPLLQDALNRSTGHDLLDQLGLVYSLAALLQSPESASLVRHILDISTRLLQSTGTVKHEYLKYIISALPSDMLVEVVECLVGKVDDLAIDLANFCSTTFQEDFVEWASNIEASILSNAKHGHYRFEPLLESWVAKTPAVPKKRPAPVFSDASDTEDDQRGDESGYDADQSRHHLSFVDIDCDDEDDLIKDLSKAGHRVPSDVLNLLSAGRASDVLTSAKLLKRFGRLEATDTEECSPLRAHKTHKGHKSRRLTEAIESPSPVRARKRCMADEEQSVSEGPKHKVRKTRTRPMRRTCPSSSPLKDIPQRARRELNNLMSSFSKRPRVGRLMAETRIRQTRDELSECENEEVDELCFKHVKSDVDELSVL